MYPSQTIKQCVWIFLIPVDEMVTFQNHAVIGNVIPQGKNVEVRVIDEKKPNNDAVQVKPNLEDAYLYIFIICPTAKGHKELSCLCFNLN
jgi:hypothetical protein